MSRLPLFAAVAAFALSGGAASATPYMLSYEDLEGNLYAASLSADLNGDGNTLENIVAFSFMINGDSFDAEIFGALSDIFGGSGNDAALTLDGSFVDFIVATADATTGFGMGPDDLSDGVAFASSIPGSSGLFSAERYQLTEATSAVPLPAALPLAIAGLGALGVVGRRRRAA